MSEHNHPRQQVGSQYNADAINIHHHGFPSELPPSTVAQIARAVEQLDQFKARFAEVSGRDVAALLEEGEDLLIFFCGSERVREWSNLARNLSDIFSRHDNTHELWDSWVRHLQGLKRRVSGIEFRGRGLKQ